MSSVTGLVEDEVINDWAFHCSAGVPDGADLESLMGIVGDFFRKGTLAVDKVGDGISPVINRAATHKIQAYKITAAGLGSPLLEIDWLGPATSGATRALPNEVAAVLSFHADLTGIQEEAGATHPKARRRGRVFIGPLNENAVNLTAYPVRVYPTFATALRANANVMADDASALGAVWSVWSRKDQVLREVVAGWTDNAVDIQRRRGEAPTARVVFTR